MFYPDRVPLGFHHPVDGRTPPQDPSTVSRLQWSFSLLILDTCVLSPFLSSFLISLSTGLSQLIFTEHHPCDLPWDFSDTLLRNVLFPSIWICSVIFQLLIAVSIMAREHSLNSLFLSACCICFMIQSILSMILQNNLHQAVDILCSL